jgi:competence protein ComEA
VVRVPELPPPPASADAGPLTIGGVVAWARSVGVARLAGVVGGAVAVAVVAAVGGTAFGPGAAGDLAPIELSLPRADAPTASPGRGDAGGGGRAAGGGGGGGGSGAPSSRIVVHVAGAVVSPGLYRLGGDPRVADALDAAGGPAADADLDAVNLAGKLADGERVYLPRRGEVPPAVVTGGAGGPTGGGGAPAGPLDLNAATAEQLESLPGVGPATAEAILSYRKEKGRFRSVEELLEVRGIGEAKLASIRSKVRV